MHSIEHINYLKKIKNNNRIVIFFQLFIFVSLLLIWELLAYKNVINPFISSSPSRVFKTIIELFNNDLFKHIFITLYEIGISFIIGSLLGLLIASILWWNRTLARIIDPYLTVLNSLPKVALGPIIIIWIGANQSAIIIMALLISTIVCIMNIYHYFNETDSNKIKLMKSLHATKKQIYFKLILPSNISNLISTLNFNTIISTLKINISMTLIGIIMGEFLTSKAGIGYLIMYGSQVFNLNIVITGTIILAIIATLLYYIIYTIEKKVKS